MAAAVAIEVVVVVVVMVAVVAAVGVVWCSTGRGGCCRGGNGSNAGRDSECNSSSSGGSVFASGSRKPLRKA